MKNKIAIFTGAFNTPTGFLIALATRCQFVHAAVCVDGEWWHSSEKLGCFGKVDIDGYANRDCAVFEFEGDLTEWLEQMKPTKYDWRGVFGWLLRLNNPTKFYCFEAAQSALLHTGAVRVPIESLSGCDLRRMATGSIQYGLFKDIK